MQSIKGRQSVALIRSKNIATLHKFKSQMPLKDSEIEMNDSENIEIEEQESVDSPEEYTKKLKLDQIVQLQNDQQKLDKYYQKLKTKLFMDNLTTLMKNQPLHSINRWTPAMICNTFMDGQLIYTSIFKLEKEYYNMSIRVVRRKALINLQKQKQIEF